MIRVGSIWFVVRSIGKVDVTGKGLIVYVIINQRNTSIRITKVGNGTTGTTASGRFTQN